MRVFEDGALEAGAFLELGDGDGFAGDAGRGAVGSNEELEDGSADEDEDDEGDGNAVPMRTQRWRRVFTLGAGDVLTAGLFGCGGGDAFSG